MGVSYHISTLHEIKLGGQWWSFFNQSYCGEGTNADTCAWRVVSVQKVINNTCLVDRIFDTIEAYPPQKVCFANCTKKQRHLDFARHEAAVAGMTTATTTNVTNVVTTTRNTSDPCWVRCAFAAVLGPQGGVVNGTITGMNVSDMEAGWEKAFDDEDKGGCSAIAPVHGK